MHGSARIEVRRVRVGAVQHIYHRGLGVRMDAGASREPGVAALGDVGRDWPDQLAPSQLRTPGNPRIGIPSRLLSRRLRLLAGICS
jgi:hypothetical protein